MPHLVTAPIHTMNHYLRSFIYRNACKASKCFACSAIVMKVALRTIVMLADSYISTLRTIWSYSRTTVVREYDHRARNVRVQLLYTNIYMYYICRPSCTCRLYVRARVYAHVYSKVYTRMYACKCVYIIIYI